MRALICYLTITICATVAVTNAATNAAEKFQQVQQNRIEAINNLR